MMQDGEDFGYSGRETPEENIGKLGSCMVAGVGILRLGLVVFSYGQSVEPKSGILMDFAGTGIVIHSRGHEGASE
jgi:hypothetical protein